jgi:hypothetical protein
MNLRGIRRLHAPGGVLPVFAKFSFELCNCVSDQRLDENVPRGTI